MEQSPSWEAGRFSASQEIPRIFWNPTIHYRIHHSPHLSLSRTSPFNFDCLIENSIVLLFFSFLFAFSYLIFVYLCWFCNWLGFLRQDVGKQEPNWNELLLLQYLIWTPSTLWLKYILRTQNSSTGSASNFIRKGRKPTYPHQQKLYLSVALSRQKNITIIYQMLED